MIGTATPDQTLTSRIIDWFKSDFSRSILLLTGVILITIIGVSLTSWRVYPLDALQRMGFIRENNPIGMDTSGFNIDSLDAVKIALQECKGKKVVSISVRPYNEVLLFNRTVISRECWDVHIRHDPSGARQGSISWVFVDPYTGHVITVDGYSWINDIN